ncbi:hypothetical protein COCOBI_11-3150 [Coccomyxa sp. Obi]|nr:hypothetical protein COCOBI_11-3150 [Coccomyxa sp. Obi]
MADMESFGRTIASLEEELAGLDESLRQEQLEKDMIKAAIAESRSQQEADQAEIHELIKRIADLECQLEDASCLEGVGNQCLAKSTLLQDSEVARRQMHGDCKAFLEQCRKFRATHEAKMLDEELLHAKEDEEQRKRMEGIQSAVASDELELAELEQRLLESENKSAALMATRKGLLRDVAAEKQKISAFEKQCSDLEAEYHRLMKQKEVQLCSRALTEEAILENRACISALEEGIRNAEKEKMQLLREIFEQEKELQHLQRSLEALSGKPCTTLNTRQETQGSARATVEASQQAQGPWQPAHGSQQHVKHRNMGKDLWPDDDVLPENPDSTSRQQGSAGDGQQINESAWSGKHQPHANMEPRASRYSLPKELDAQSSFMEQRSEQQQSYIVTEPDSPKVSTEAPTGESLGSHQMNQIAQPIVYTETSVTRTVTPIKDRYRRQQSWTVRELRQVPTSSAPQHQAAFYAAVKANSNAITATATYKDTAPAAGSHAGVHHNAQASQPVPLMRVAAPALPEPRSHGKGADHDRRPAAARGGQRGRAPRKPRRALKRIYREDSDDELHNAMTKKRDLEQNDDAEEDVAAKNWSVKILFIKSFPKSLKVFKETPLVPFNSYFV